MWNQVIYCAYQLVKEENQPHKIYRSMLVEELMKKGHYRKLAERALKKGANITVEAADAWIKQNIEWLHQPMHSESVANEHYMPLSKKEILHDEKLTPNT